MILLAAAGIACLAAGARRLHTHGWTRPVAAPDAPKVPDVPAVHTLSVSAAVADHAGRLADWMPAAPRAARRGAR